MAALKLLKHKPASGGSAKKYMKGPSAGHGHVNAPAAKALTRKTTIDKLTADLTRIILDEEAFGLSKNNVLIELGFDGKQFQLKSADNIPATARQFDPNKIGLSIVETAKTTEGGAWTGAELNERFGLNPSTLHRRRKEHRVVFWRDARHDFHYPQWQFTPTGALITGIDEVLNTFKSPDEWRIMRYFLVPRHQLGERTPLDLLRNGEVEKVLAHARAHAEENSW